MVLTGAILLALVGAYIGAAVWLAQRRQLTFHQAALYLPLKLLYRIDDREIAEAYKASTPVIYVVTHQSRLDPMLMLSLLPAGTLHILDEASAKSMRLEPWRELARTIAFNAAHLFASRRLVRHLRGRGRLAVYLPLLTDPAPKSLSLYRAVARIAARAEASIVAISIDGYGNPSPAIKADAAGFGALPRLTVRALPAATLDELSGVGQERATPGSNILLDRLNQTRGAAGIKQAA